MALFLSPFSAAILKPDLRDELNHFVNFIHNSIHGFAVENEEMIK